MAKKKTSKSIKGNESDSFELKVSTGECVDFGFDRGLKTYKGGIETRLPRTKAKHKEAKSKSEKTK